MGLKFPSPPLCGVFLCQKQKASLLKDAFFISDSEFFPGKSNLSFFPVIPVFFPMKHFSKKRQSFNRLPLLLLFSAGFFFQYFFPIFRPGIGMLPHSLTAVCLSFLYAGNRNISPCFRNQRKNRLPFPCKNFSPESGPANSPEFTGIFFIVSRETILIFFSNKIEARKPQRHNTDKSRIFVFSAIRNHPFRDDF